MLPPAADEAEYFVVAHISLSLSTLNNLMKKSYIDGLYLSKLLQ